MRSEVLAHLGMDAEDLDESGTTNLDLLINRSFWEVQDKFAFREKQEKIVFSTVAGTREYTLTTVVTGVDSTITLEAFQSISITDPDTSDHIPLDSLTPREYESEYNEQTSVQDMPTHYILHGGKIILYPTPDEAYSCTLYILKILADDGYTTIPQAWHEIVMLGAIYRGHLRNRDFNSASQVKAQQIALLNSTPTQEAKEEIKNRYVGVDVIGREY